MPRAWPLLLLLPWAPAYAQYDSFKKVHALVPMRDGVKLSTDIYIPARAGAASREKFPVLLFRTPYNQAMYHKLMEQVVLRGFAVVSQDVRGRFGSEGEFYAFVNEGLDGYDAVEWAAAQPWSNGKVGMFGSSYMAWDQYHAAMHRPPHLDALFAIVGGANFYQEFGHPGGIPNLGWASWILNTAISSHEADKNPEARARLKTAQKDLARWLALPRGERSEVFRDLPSHGRIYLDFFAHPAFDSYWKQKGFWTAGYYDEIKDIPMFFLTGWYDYFGEGVLENFGALSRRQKTPKQLLVGPWPHGALHSSPCGDVDFGAEAAADRTGLIADWFDHCFRGGDFPIKSPVRIFRMGGGEGSRAGGVLKHGGRWEDLPSWPPPARPVRYYLGASGKLSDAPGAGQPIAYVHDPANPVPTIGGRYGRSPCAQDQACGPKWMGCSGTGLLNRRPDLVSFVSAPLDKGLDLTGKGKARLWVESDAESADFIVKLMDAYPDGGALLLVEGQLRVKTVPGRAQQIEIPLESTSNWFAPGHRIRVDIASSSFPRNETNPLKARNTIYRDSRRPSHVELPIR